MFWNSMYIPVTYFWQLTGKIGVFKTKTNCIQSRHCKCKTKCSIHIFCIFVHSFVLMHTFFSDSYLTPYLTAVDWEMSGAMVGFSTASDFTLSCLVTIFRTMLSWAKQSLVPLPLQDSYWGSESIKSEITPPVSMSTVLPWDIMSPWKLGLRGK